MHLFKTINDDNQHFQNRNRTISYRDTASMPRFSGDIQLVGVISDCELNSLDAAVRNKVYSCQNIITMQRSNIPVFNHNKHDLRSETVKRSE